MPPLLTVSFLESDEEQFDVVKLAMEFAMEASVVLQLGHCEL